MIKALENDIQQLEILNTQFDNTNHREKKDVLEHLLEPKVRDRILDLVSSLKKVNPEIVSETQQPNIKLTGKNWERVYTRKIGISQQFANYQKNHPRLLIGSILTSNGKYYTIRQKEHRSALAKVDVNEKGFYYKIEEIDSIGKNLATKPIGYSSYNIFGTEFCDVEDMILKRYKNILYQITEKGYLKPVRFISDADMDQLYDSMFFKNRKNDYMEMVAKEIINLNIFGEYNEAKIKELISMAFKGTKETIKVEDFHSPYSGNNVLQNAMEDREKEFDYYTKLYEGYRRIEYIYQDDNIFWYNKTDTEFTDNYEAFTKEYNALKNNTISYDFKNSNYDIHTDPVDIGATRYFRTLRLMYRFYNSVDNNIRESRLAYIAEEFPTRTHRKDAKEAYVEKKAYAKKKAMEFLGIKKEDEEVLGATLRESMSNNRAHNAHNNIYDMSRGKSTYSPDFQTRVVLELLEDKISIEELAKKHNVEIHRIKDWKILYLDLMKRMKS